MKNRAVKVVVDLDGRVDAENDWDVFGCAAGPMDGERHILTRSDAATRSGSFKTSDVECLCAIKFQRRGVRAFLELARQDAHADEVAAMNPFEALRDDGFHSQQTRSLGSPVTR